MFYGYAYFAVPQVVGVLYPAVYWPSTDPTLAIGEKEKEKLDMRTLAIYGPPPFSILHLTSSILYLL